MNYGINLLEDEAFDSLDETVVKRIKEKEGVKKDNWISTEEAMEQLRIKSKTTLQKLRDEGKIRFSHPENKIILSDAERIQSAIGHRPRALSNLDDPFVNYCGGNLG